MSCVGHIRCNGCGLLLQVSHRMLTNGYWRRSHLKSLNWEVVAPRTGYTGSRREEKHFCPSCILKLTEFQDKEVVIDYTNWRGIRQLREVTPRVAGSTYATRAAIATRVSCD